MGLAGRKQKQRIPTDPRNLSWADDASRFGLSYLSKFGWDASQGLGASGEGVKTHIKVQQKLDMMGIGAQHQRDPNGIAWKQNRDFEALLKRLNKSIDDDEGNRAETKIGDKRFIRVQEEKVEEEFKDDDPVKKRKHKDRVYPDSDEHSGKKRKREKKEKYPKSDSDISSAPNSSSSPTPKHRPMAHRARIRAAKRITDKSASAISEILGIAPSSSVSTSTPTPPPAATPDPQPGSLSLDNLTTSTKSVADYFKEKLLPRSITSSTPSILQVPSGFSKPGLGATRSGTRLTYIHPLEEGELPRKGIVTHVSTLTLPSQTSGPGSTSGNGGDDADSHVSTTKKMCRKAERKTGKRRRAEAQQPTRENSGKDHAEERPTESVEIMQKEKKTKRRQK